MAQSVLGFLQRERWWLAANVAGIALYEGCSLSTAAPPALRGSGASMLLWSATCLPILLLFALANLVWLVQRARNDVPADHWRAMPMVLGVAACWLCAVAIDGLLH